MNKRYFHILILAFSSLNIYAQSRPKYLNADGGMEVNTTLNYDMSWGVPVVNVSIHGKPYRFIFDTGAGLTYISERVMRETGARKSGKFPVVDFNNSISYHNKVALNDIHIGEIRFGKSTVVALPDDNFIFRCLGVDGIIGSRLLYDFLVVFDSSERTITLSNTPRRVVAAPDEAWHKMKLFGRTYPFIEVRAKSNSKRGYSREYVLFDSGNGNNSVTMSERKRLENEGIITNITQSQGVISRGVNGFGEKRKIWRGTVKRVDVAGFAIDEIPCTSGMLDNFGMRLTDFGILSLDYHRRRYCFMPFEQADSTKWVDPTLGAYSAVEDGRLIITSVWNPQLSSIIGYGDRIVAVGDRQFTEEQDDCTTEHLDTLIEKYALGDNPTVSIEDRQGVVHVLPAALFLNAR